MAFGRTADTPRGGTSAGDSAAGSPDAQAINALPAPETIRKGDMIYRRLGRTGELVSALGLGGSHIGKVDSEDEAVAIIRAAVDAGLTFMDNSWDYNNGRSERWMGQALRDGYRDRVFLMSKIDGRTKKAAGEQIDESLRRLQTDHLDLMQHHEIIRLHDPDIIFQEGGAQEAMLAAQKAGKIRYIGFTGHKDPLVHLRMLDTAAEHGFHFDTVQMPVNPMDAHFRSFSVQVLPRLLRENIGVLGMKSMGSGILLRSGAVTAEECLRYALTLPTAVVITGIDGRDILEQDLAIARGFEPMTDEEIVALLQKTKQPAADGAYELFKTTARFDSTARNPEWLG